MVLYEILTTDNNRMIIKVENYGDEYCIYIPGEEPLILRGWDVFIGWIRVNYGKIIG